MTYVDMSHAEYWQTATLAVHTWKEAIDTDDDDDDNNNNGN
jgi:hypothetical protein